MGVNFLIGTAFLFSDDENVLEMMAVQYCDYTSATELFTLNG
jgi:hypothetical protein